METTQNIIILILLIGIVWLYLDNKSLKYWRNYYLKESNDSFDYNIKVLQENKKLSELNFNLEEKLNKAEEIISQQKQELLTRKQSKKK
jgi:hypothetical protein